MADFLSSSIFGELTQQTQVVIDEASKRQKELFDKTIFSEYLDWDVPSLGLNFEEAIGKSNISVMASTIGDRSKEPVMQPLGIETMREKVLTHAISRPMESDTYRKVLQMLDSKRLAPAEKTKQLISLMFGEVKNVVDGVNAKLDYIFLSALSNEGVCTLDSSNNPEGGVRSTINYQQPVSNIISADSTKKWTANNQADVDPIACLVEVLDQAEQKAVIGKILMSPSMLAYIRNCPKAKKAVFGSDKGNGVLTLASLNAYLEANQMPIIEPIRRFVNVQNTNGTLTQLTPWNTNNIVFVPAGKIGTMKNAYTDSELMPSQGVTYSNSGRIRVSQWGVGEQQGSNRTDFTKAESVSLPFISQIDSIFTFKANY